MTPQVTSWLELERKPTPIPSSLNPCTSCLTALKEKSSPRHYKNYRQSRGSLRGRRHTRGHGIQGRRSDSNLCQLRPGSQVPPRETTRTRIPKQPPTRRERWRRKSRWENPRRFQTSSLWCNGPTKEMVEEVHHEPKQVCPMWQNGTLGS